jgi:transcriptional regulator with XRE-family HTH domain
MTFAMAKEPMTRVNPATCRAARALLDWTQTDLATRAHVSIGTIRDFEAGTRTILINNSRAIQAAFEEAGVEFLNTNAPGVRLRPRSDGQATRSR